MALDPKDIATLTPTFLNTLFKHFKNEIPDSNWDLKLHLGIVMLRGFLQRGKHKTIEKHQKFLAKAYIPCPPSVSVKKAIIPETCRSQAEDIMTGLLSGQKEEVGWRWKEDPMKQNLIKGEWVEAKNRKKLTSTDRVILYVHGGAYFMGSAAHHRFLVHKVAKAGAARAFSFDYRLAPQSPFPAAVVDTLAAYFYLTQPPADAGFEAINPKQIIIMGDSAGGGLALSTMLVLRDAGLPTLAGAICWSPWVDLYHSLPSIFSNASTDYIPNGFVHKASPANPIKDFKNVQERLDRVQYYAYNSALSSPYVSPILADDLGGLGEILIICGGGERLRDEAILFAHKAAKTHPELFECKKPDVRTYPPTKVNLNIYEAMPHVFQLFLFHPAAINAVERTGAFIRKILPEPTNDSLSLSSYSSFSSSSHSSSSSSNTSNTISTFSFHHHREKREKRVKDAPNSNPLKQKSSSLSIQEFFEDELDYYINSDGEINYFTSKYIDIKGNCKRLNDMLDEGTLREWTNKLGKLPDLEAHPEFMDL